MAEPRRLTELAAATETAADIPSGPLAVALSGGADSAALIWFCRRLDRQVRAIHVHHGLAASDRLADAATAIAAQVGVDLQIERVTVPRGPSPENQARLVRYEALNRAVRPGEWILTAHTSDDQAETVLDHLLRTAGPDGLRGIPARRPPFARPLLMVDRSTTRELATLAGLPWVDDPVNESLDPLRNRIRLRLLPMLETYNRRIRQSLAITADLVAADVAYLDSMITTGLELEPGRVKIPASALTTVEASPATRLARRFLAAAGLDAASVAAVAGTLAVARGEAERHQPGAGISIRREGALLVAETDSPSLPSPVDLEIAGETGFGRWVFGSFVSEEPPTAMPLGAAWMVADADVMVQPQVEPAGEHPAVHELLTVAGVAAADRPGYPVLVADGQVVWVPFVRRLGAGWVDGKTRRYLVVRTRTERTWQRSKP